MSNSIPFTASEFDELFGFLTTSTEEKISKESEGFYRFFRLRFDEENMPDLETFILKTRNELTQPFDYKSTSSLDILLLKGAEYIDLNIDPTKKDVLKNILSDIHYDFIIDEIRNVLKGAYADIEKGKLVSSLINNVVSRIAKGYAIGNFENRAKSILKVIKEEPEFFSEKYKIGFFSGKMLIESVRKISVLKSLGFSVKSTIPELCKEWRTIEKLEDEFKKINSPDKRRTILDRIETIEKKLQDASDNENSIHRHFKNGYLYATRGEAPPCIELKFVSFRYVQFEDEYFSYINKINDGYASAFHLKYLQDVLESLNVSGYTEPIAGKRGSMLQLKWAGNNNQLYDIIRQLKKADLLLNSYTDLAVFLKASIDKLEYTALSTIQKELEKEKRPMKQRRIELNFNSSQDDMKK